MQTNLNKLFLLLSFFMFSNIFAQCDMPENTLSVSGTDIWYNSSSDIGGFQFNVDGTTILSVLPGGDASDSGFTVSNSSTTVLGFSFTGGVISQGCGTLVSLDLSGEASGLSGIVMSDQSGNALNFSYYESDGGDDCASGVYDCAGDCDGEAVEDCAGDCGGSAVVDECGECGGNGADVMCDDGSYVCDESDCSGDGDGWDYSY